MKSDQKEIVIRKYADRDRDSIRNIACETAFMGRPAEMFIADRDVLADFLTSYFTDYEPESCFVSESDGRVIGYLIGAKDEIRLKTIFRSKIVMPLLIKSITNGMILKKKNMVLALSFLSSFLIGDFKEPDFTEEYPAILHINVLEKFRVMGIGSRLISAYLDYLRKERVRGVHLGTISEEAGIFFISQGFHLLHKGTRSYFRHILHRDISVYIYGKLL